MAQTEDYVQIMIESLQKKQELLQKIEKKNEAQKEVLTGKTYDDVAWDKFDLLMTEKEIAIDRINKLDDGFQTLYDRVSEALKQDKSRYAEQIRTMQALITSVTDLGAKIQTSEEKNRQLIDKIMTAAKKEIRQARTSMKAATTYYQTMRNSFIGDDTSTWQGKK